MPEVAVRFAIGDSTRRASTWKCWATVGSNKNDVYLANRALGRALKASLHQSGRWRVAFDQAFLDQHAKPDEWPTRVVQQWDRPSELAPGFTLAFRIVTPSTAVNIAGMPDAAEIVWVEPPPDGRSVEVDVIITACSTFTSSWPGHRSMATSLVGQMALDNGDTIWLVSRIVDTPGRNLTVNASRYFHGRTLDDVRRPGLRAILFGTEPDGSRVMYDVAFHPTNETAPS